MISHAATGRLFVILTRKNEPEPRVALGDNGPDAPFVIARDVNELAPGATAVLDTNAITFPVTNLSEAPAGNYYIQTLLESNRDLLLPDAPGNLYSGVKKIHLDAARGGVVKLELDHRIPDEQLPADTELVKFVKIQSRLLSQFHGRPIYLRAVIILPRDHGREPDRKYPLWVRIGGYGERYTAAASLMEPGTDFRKNWMADGTPRMIYLFLDGAGPYGDPYQVNSANNGPYGDAIVRELIPYVEEKFGAIGEPRARALSGISTGGWVSLALQVYYPDFFNGTWASCPDPVDFRALELINIYSNDNAYVNEYGAGRPSVRSANGDVITTLRREVRMENVLGRGDNWTMSGGQWGAWNATFGPRGPDGRPAVLWDPETGKINHAVADKWKQYDLRLYMQAHWKTLGPKLQGKLHICVGDADNFFLNNAVHLLDEFLSKADPPYKGRIVYGPGKEHGWSDVSMPKKMKEMEAAIAGGSVK